MKWFQENQAAVKTDSEPIIHTILYTLHTLAAVHWEQKLFSKNIFIKNSRKVTPSCSPVCWERNILLHRSHRSLPSASCLPKCSKDGCGGSGGGGEWSVQPFKGSYLDMRKQKSICWSGVVVRVPGTSFNQNGGPQAFHLIQLIEKQEGSDPSRTLSILGL